MASPTTLRCNFSIGVDQSPTDDAYLDEPTSMSNFSGQVDALNRLYKGPEEAFELGRISVRDLRTSLVTRMVAFMVLSQKTFRGRWDTMKTLLVMKTDRSAK